MRDLCRAATQMAPLQNMSTAADMQSNACRRGAKEVAGLLEQLKVAAERMCKANDVHMAQEESSILPVLQASLCAAEQRTMVWRTLRAMPLRLLERMLPWLAGMSCSRLTCTVNS